VLGHQLLDSPTHLVVAVAGGVEECCSALSICNNSMKISRSVMSGPAMATEAAAFRQCEIRRGIAQVSEKLGQDHQPSMKRRNPGRRKQVVEAPIVGGPVAFLHPLLHVLMHCQGQIAGRPLLFAPGPLASRLAHGITSQRSGGVRHPADATGQDAGKQGEWFRL
jgi:hypothetical protein